MGSKSSQQWMKEHFSDPYVKEAQAKGYRSRAVFKLLEIQRSHRLFKPGMRVIDLGAAPGGWSQVIAPLVLPNGCVLALDVLEMAPIDGVYFICGDFTKEATLSQIDQALPGKVDWVVSDMAPNMSGHKGVDIPKSLYIAELVIDFAVTKLKKSGGLLLKSFQGEGFEALIKQMRHNFKTIKFKKPRASRERSREIYILARNLKGG